MCLIAACDDNQRVIPKRNQKGWWYICLPSLFYKCGLFFFWWGVWFSECFQAVVLRFGPIPSFEAIKHGRYRAAKNKKEVIWIDDLHVGFNCSMLFCQSFSSHGMIKFTIDVPSIESQLDVFGTNVALRGVQTRGSMRIDKEIVGWNAPKMSERNVFDRTRSHLAVFQTEIGLGHVHGLPNGLPKSKAEHLRHLKTNQHIQHIQFSNIFKVLTHFAACYQPEVSIIFNYVNCPAVLRGQLHSWRCKKMARLEYCFFWWLRWWLIVHGWLLGHVGINTIWTPYKSTPYQHQHIKHKKHHIRSYKHQFITISKHHI